MSLTWPRPVDATLHGVVDYQAAASLLTLVPRLAGVGGTRSARQIRMSGAIHGAYSAVTDYPLGVIKVIPYKGHLALDALGAAALAATPFVTGQYREGRRHWMPHVALALIEFASLAMTDPTGKGDYHGDLQAVVEAKDPNPPAAEQEGLAVTPGAAA